MMLFVTMASYGFTFETGTGYHTQYVFRGQRLIDSPALTPFVTIGGEHVELKVTNVYNMDNKDFYKSEYQLTFKTEIEKVNLDVGFLRHDIASSGIDTNEFFVKAAWNAKWKPFIAVYFDVKKGSGKFIQGGLERQFKAGKNVVAFGGRLSYLIDNGYMGLNTVGQEFTGAYNGELYLSSKFNISKHFIVEPMLGYTFPLSSESKGAIQRLSVNGEENTLYGGITLSTAF